MDGPDVGRDPAEKPDGSKEQRPELWPPSCPLDCTRYNTLWKNNSRNICFFFNLLALETKSEARKTILLEIICRKHEGWSSSPEFVKTKMCELVHTCNPSIEEVETGGHLGLADLKRGRVCEFEI